MSETSQAEAFTERVDVSTQPDGAFIGTMEIEIRPGADPEEERVRSCRTSVTGCGTASPSWKRR
jgi:hypothetical protein